MAYQSLLTSTRQRYHQQLAQALEARSETVETQPELLAHPYTEAGLIAQAIPYWATLRPPVTETLLADSTRRIVEKFQPYKVFCSARTHMARLTWIVTWTYSW